MPSHDDVLSGARSLRDAGYTFEGRSGDAVRLRAKTPPGDRTIEGSDVLVAAGRTPQTREIGLEEAGIALDARGFVKVDDRLQATAAGVWAVGECAGSQQFTHVAFDDCRVVRDNLSGKVRSTSDRLIPYCAFIDPELARVGLDQTTAQQQRIAAHAADFADAAHLTWTFYQMVGMAPSALMRGDFIEIASPFTTSPRLPAGVSPRERPNSRFVQRQ